MSESGDVLTGVERLFVFNRLRAAVGVRVEMPYLLRGLDVAPGARSLEIGAGLGWGTLGLLHPARPSLAVVTDYDPAVLPTARAYLAGSRARLAFARADAKHLPFPDGTFDIVLAVYALHHVMGYTEALREIARVLRPAGRLLLIDPVRPTWFPRIRTWAPPDGLPTRAELEALLRGGGFAVERWAGMSILAYIRARLAAHVVGNALGSGTRAIS